MRIILFLVILFSFSTIKAQPVLPFGMPAYSQQPGFANNIPGHDSLSKSKWFVSTYKGFSTRLSFFNGGQAAILAAPVGLQLNRRLNNHFYAFANVAVTPAFINLNPSFITTGLDKNYQGNTFSSNSLNVYPSVSLGVMYVNDARTFSISGSISAERSSYPLLPYHAANTAQSGLMQQTR